MKRICYVIPTLQIGGSERQLIALIEGLKERFEITVICTRELGPLAGQVRQFGIPVRNLAMATAWDPRMRGRLRALFRDHRPDILHTFLFGFDLGANQAARDTGVPVIVSSRRELAVWQRTRHIWRQRYANRFVDAIVANSHAAARTAQSRERTAAERYHVIHNGILADAFQTLADPDRVREHLGIPAGRKVVTTVANFSEVKDYPLFLSMAAEVRKRYPDVHFLAVGKGPMQAEINRLVVRHSLEKHITMFHTPDQIPDILAASDVFVLCSRAEGFPNALMEAMAAGRPVVARAVGGIPELVTDGVSGRLVEERSADAMAGAVVSLLSDRRAANRLAMAGSDCIRRDFSLIRMVEAYHELYTRLLAGSARVVG